jgi:DNA polymerase delta subunit 4
MSQSKISFRHSRSGRLASQEDSKKLYDNSTQDDSQLAINVLASTTPAKSASQQHASSSPLSPDEIEIELTKYDLTSEFGPLSGLTRLERWERAETMGLQPPPVVKKLILEHGGSNQHVFS